MASTHSLRGDLLFLRERMSRAFEESMQDSVMVAGPGRFVPCVDIYEDDSTLYVKIELPGVRREDIALDITDGVLTISGTKPCDHVDAAENFHLVERQYGLFRRSFSLPESIDLDRVEASFNAGVLEISLPRLETRVSRKIPVTGEAG